MTEESIGEQLVRWGKVVLVETRGRRSGQPVRVAVGYLEEADGTLLVAAGDERADWVRNLHADPHCRATIGERTTACVAELVDDPAQRGAALTALILKYGTPAERLGAGPVFRLSPQQ